MEFPIHARHPDGSVWYEILSALHFREWKRLGASREIGRETFIFSEIVSHDYSTSLYIKELLALTKTGELEIVSHAELIERVEN